MTVVNINGTPDGTQLLGTVTVNTCGTNASGVQYYEDDRVTYPVASTSGEVVDRFDNPRYYTGDTDN